MASHYQPHLCHHQPPPPPPPSTACCCNPSHHCCPSPPPSTDHLLQAIASLLPHSHPLPTQIFTNSPQFDQSQSLKCFSRNRPRPPHEQDPHSTIASLLCRIEALESSLHRFSSSHNSYSQSSHHHHHYYYSLRHTAARVIQTHFRAFLVRRSRTLRQLKELGFIKSTFNSLKSSLSNDSSRADFAALSRKAMDLLLQLDSIEGDDPMIRDGKGSISRDLLRFLDSLEGIAVKKHLRLVKTMKNVRYGQNINKPRVLNPKHGNLGHDQRKVLENLKGRVEKISQLCKLSANDEEQALSERILLVANDDDDDDDDDGGPSIVISRKNGVPTTKIQPKVKKSVSFAESGNVSKIYCNTYEPEQSLSEVVTCLDGDSSSDEQEEVLENIRNEVEDVMDSSRGAEDDEEAIPGDVGSAHNSSDGERNSRRHPKKDGKNEGKLVFSAPLPLKMETRDELMKNTFTFMNLSDHLAYTSCVLVVSVRMKNQFPYLVLSKLKN
ncbi:BAG family molecular chaperone regulator 8, chloroplastic [Senna tora]|uniref:BAG family molecular chaperone regulator 8, chloroplastic n=1 Tax=Senna tora TaxID=362788 RepID=A0A834SEW9_9FABA|nr:BAG family molecular chaperone regulator 8, chloroplastic [Senna tora]